MKIIINKKANIVIELLISMILVVVTSAIIFVLVQQGIITVKSNSSSSNQQILNTEFLPMGREGYLAIKEFKFCNYINEFNCINPSETFNTGSQIYFLVLAESSTYNGEIILVQNYRIKSPSGKLMLDAEEKNNFHFDIFSKEKNEIIAFKDYFVVTDGSESGVYTLELILENRLLNKKVVSVQNFVVQAG